MKEDNMRYNGIVTRFDAISGLGYISPDTQDCDVTFQKEELKKLGVKTLEAGTKCSYEISLSGGCYRAVHLRFQSNDYSSSATAAAATTTTTLLSTNKD